MLSPATLSALAILLSLASALSCPQVSFRVFGPSDSTCSSTHTDLTLKNLTCIEVPNGYHSAEAGTANDPAWDANCGIFNAYGSCKQATNELTAGENPYNGTAGSFGTCKDVQNKNDGKNPNFVIMVCKATGGVQNCGPD